MSDRSTATTVHRLLDHAGPTYAAEAGIRLTDKPAPLYRLLVLSTLLSSRIKSDIAVDAAKELANAKLTTPRAMQESRWQDRVDALGRAHYRRYDEQTATALGESAATLRAARSPSSRPPPSRPTSPTCSRPSPAASKPSAASDPRHRRCPRRPRPTSTRWRATSTSRAAPNFLAWTWKRPSATPPPDNATPPDHTTPLTRPKPPLTCSKSPPRCVRSPLGCGWFPVLEFRVRTPERGLQARECGLQARVARRRAVRTQSPHTGPLAFGAAW